MAQIEDPDYQDTMDHNMKRSLLARSKRAIIVRNPNGNTEYRCVECPMGFNDKSGMEEHLSVHNQEYRFLCGICGTALKRKEHLDRHTLEHKEVRPHICPDCGKGFKRKEHLNIHRTIHSGEKNHVCPLCDKCKLHIHTLDSLEHKEVRPRICPDCGKGFKRKEHLNIHRTIHSGEKNHVCPLCDKCKLHIHTLDSLEHKEVRPRICPDCGKGFKRKEHLNIHRTIHSREKNHVCPLCDKCKLHLHTLEHKEVRPHICPDCGKGFKRKEHLNIHRTIHSGEKNHVCPLCDKCKLHIHTLDSLEHKEVRPRICPDCSKGFKRKKHLNIHCTIHSGEKNHVCPLCDKCKLHLHTQEHKEVRPHICPDCGKGFKRKEHLNIHRTIHSGEKNHVCPLCDKCKLHIHTLDSLEHKEVRPRICPDCSKGFKRKKHLNIHCTIHSGEKNHVCPLCDKCKLHLHTQEHKEVRPHICPDCGKGFKRKEHLNIHRTIHSGEKNHVCPLCDKSFYRKDHLQKHLQTHNKMFIEQNIFPVSDQELLGIKQEVTDDQLGDDMMVEIPDAGLEKPVDPERPHICPVCHKGFKRKDHLKLHSVSHLARDKLCPHCEKAFRTEEQLHNQMITHVKLDSPVRDEESYLMEEGFIQEEDPLLIPRVSMEEEDVRTYMDPAGDRPYSCKLCGRRFKRKQHLKVHANVHERNQPPTIWCSICSEGFFSNIQFESHECMGADPDEQPTNQENSYPTQDNVEIMNVPIVTEEPDLPGLPVPRRVFVCKYCGKPFKRKDHYRIHLHVHTGVKSFFCEDCGKGFYRKDHLQKHSQVHNKAKPNPRSPPRKPKKEMPELFPIHMLPKKTDLRVKPDADFTRVRPEITITAPSNTKLRVPLQIKVPYQVVTSLDNGEQRVTTVDPRELMS